MTVRKEARLFVATPCVTLGVARLIADVQITGWIVGTVHVDLKDELSVHRNEDYILRHMYSRYNVQKFGVLFRF